MQSHLDEIQYLLNDFETELSKLRTIWRQLEINNPDFEEVSEYNWQEKHTSTL